MIVRAGVAVVAVGIAVSSPAQSPSFCQRMAAELPMKEKRAVGVRRMFDMPMLNLAQRLLVGGTATAAMSLTPIGESYDAAESRRLDRLCKGPICTIDGPMVLGLTLNDAEERRFEARAGDKARVSVRGVRLRCEDL